MQKDLGRGAQNIWTAGSYATDQLCHLFSTLLTLPHFDRWVNYADEEAEFQRG